MSACNRTGPAQRHSRCRCRMYQPPHACCRNVTVCMQILILEGPPVAVSSGKQGTGNSCSSQHTAHWQAGSPASTAAAAGGGSGSEHHWPGPVDPPSAGAAHRRTRSSNTQLPPLEEHTVLSEPGLAGALQPTTTAAGAQVLTLPAAEALGLQSMGSDGLTGYHSRRSSRADSDISSGADSTAGGLVCEPSSFGVCADPAGETQAHDLAAHTCRFCRALCWQHHGFAWQGLAGTGKAVV